MYGPRKDWGGQGRTGEAKEALYGPRKDWGGQGSTVRAKEALYGPRKGWEGCVRENVVAEEDPKLTQNPVG